MKKVLVICGPTSTGKTSLAIYLAKKFNGELISADSRQVYRKLDIGTGKDLLKDSKFVLTGYKWFGSNVGYYATQGIKLWGYDLVDPKKNFSAGQYLGFAKKAVETIHSAGKLPILVGGTGLYIKAVVDGIPTALVPRNNALRQNLADKKPGELYEVLAQLDPIRAGSMNTSDGKNPRRLARAIEVAMWKLEDSRRFAIPPTQNRKGRPDVLFVGLCAEKEVLFRNIERRVEKRIDAGLEKEIRGLLSSGITWKMQSMSSLGYRQWREYFEKTKTKETVVKDWIKEEKRYAKRQITWFKKDRRLQWFDIAENKFRNNVEKLVKKWYKEGDGKKS